MTGTTFFQIYMRHSDDVKDVCVTVSHPPAAAHLLRGNVVAFGQRAPPGGLCGCYHAGPLGEQVRAVLGHTADGDTLASDHMCVCLQKDVCTD